MKRFRLQDVQIKDSNWLGKIRSNASFLDAMEIDRVLAGFRRTAGVETDALPYGGWEDSLIAGHGVGHYFSAQAMWIAYLRGQMRAAEIDARTEEYLSIQEELAANVKKAEMIVNGLSECQKSLGSGFLSAATVQDEDNPEIQFDVLEGKASAQQWVPWYALHKVLQGLIDLWQYAGIEGADSVTIALADWVCDRVLSWDEETRKRVLSVEYGGMNDSLYQLYGITGNESYLHAARVFDEPELYKDLLSFKNRMRGVHANATIPKIIGYLAGAFADDASERIAIAEKFFDTVIRNQTYATGGIGDMEHFFGDGLLDGSRTQCNAESCCAYNMMKLSQMLYEKTGKIKYIEYIERTLWNAKLGSIGPDGGYTYFNPMATGYYRLYSPASPKENPFWCCVGTGMEDFAKVEDQVFYRNGDEVVVAQWISSDLLISEDISLSLKVDFDEGVLILKHADRAGDPDKIPDLKEGEVKSPYETETIVKLRVPRWIKNRDKYLPDDEEYFRIILDGESGLRMEFEMELRSHVLPDAPSAVGFTYGPFVLGVPLGVEKWNISAGAGIDVYAPAWKVVFGSMVKGDITYGKTNKCILGEEFLTLPEGVTVESFCEDLSSYISKRDDGSFLLTGLSDCKGRSVELTLKPYWQMGDERYGIYWYLNER